VVVNAPAGNIISTAEHTIALIFALARHVPQASAKLKSGDWQRQQFMGTEVRNKTLGIIGLGRVGSEVAKRAIGLEMHAIAHDPFLSADQAHHLGVELVSLEQLLKEADFITIHIPMTRSTKGLIGDKELALVKPEARIINTARGGIVDEEALFKAVEEGKVAGAAIDVFSKEPAVDNILLKSDRIIVTPHLGASTTEAQTSVALDVAEQVLAVLNGTPARYAVNVPLITTETASVLVPFMAVATSAGRLSSQLVEGQVGTITIKYEGEIAEYHTAALTAAALVGLLEMTTEESVNVVNAGVIAQRRGLKIVEQKVAQCDNYSNLISVEVTSDKGTTIVAGTLLWDEPHIVLVNEHWLDIVPTGGYWLFSDHLDQPGLIGSVGMVAGKADINISSMHLARLKLRGQALMVLSIDEPLDEETRQQILAIPGVDTARVVKL